MKFNEAQTNFSNVQGDGGWSVQTDDGDGPIDLAFYVVADYNCAGPVVSTDYLPSWFENQPFGGTDVATATAPAGATAVTPGRSDVRACLGSSQLPDDCVAPTATFNGRVVTKGQQPLELACIFALGRSGPVGQAISGADGRWTITDLPVDFPLVVGVIPPFDTGDGPCRTEGPPPVPAAGQLQPEFYRNTWADLSDTNLLQDPYDWATARGAVSISNSRHAIDVCLTSDPGTVRPRPPCDPASASPQPSTSPTLTPPTDAPASVGSNSGTGTDATLADTGGPMPWTAASGILLLTLGVVAIRRSARRTILARGRRAAKKR